MIKFMDRLLLFIYSFIVGICAFILLIVSFDWLSNEFIIEFMYELDEEAWMQITTIIIVSALILLSVRLLYLTVRSGKSTNSIDQRTDYGDIRISIETVENLSLKAASKVKGTKDIKARVQVNQEGLEIIVRTLVDGETSITELTEEVQRTVKSNIEEIAGIPVASVSVFVANIQQSQTFKSRVE